MTSTLHCSLSEFAELRGCSESYARRLRRKGRLVLDEYGRVLIEPSTARIAATADMFRSKEQPTATARADDVSRESSLADGLRVLYGLADSAHNELSTIRDRCGAAFDADPCLVKTYALLEASRRRLHTMLAKSPDNAPAHLIAPLVGAAPGAHLCPAGHAGPFRHTAPAAVLPTETED